ncbi:MAG: ImmA/IrrE family metallo-endopeptidase [Selenomonadaceae bacterium]|nr:ImmA/IrrE family metallo-endopeptidase [Selenomonadaceae bacterium]
MGTSAEELIILAKKVPQNFQDMVVQDKLAVDFLRVVPKFNAKQRKAVKEIIDEAEGKNKLYPVRPFEIEKIANNILQNENVTEPPVMATQIADLSYDLSFGIGDLGNYSNSGDVLAAINVAEKVIVLNSSKEYELCRNKDRKNFTIAHELGHYILHRDLRKTALPATKKFFCRAVGKFAGNIERQADLFAVYLLMPEKLVREEYSKIVEPFTEYDLECLAEKFCVSKEAVKIRLSKELKLIYVDNQGNYYRSEIEFQESVGQQRLF